MTLDLSEQTLISCGNASSCSAGAIDAASDFLSNSASHWRAATHITPLTTLLQRLFQLGRQRYYALQLLSQMAIKEQMMELNLLGNLADVIPVNHHF